MIEWNDAAPLRSGPGRALAMMIVDRPRAEAHMLVTGTLEYLAGLVPPPKGADTEQAEGVLTAYLAGVAAAAIVADAALGARRWTGARDYAVHGDAVVFLPPETALLGTLTVAMTAVGRALEMAPTWGVPRQGLPLAPERHGEVVAEIQQALAQAAQARIGRAAIHADEVNGD